MISEENIPYVVVIYLNRGKIGMYFDENSKNINIGGLKDEKANIFKRAKHLVIDWLWWDWFRSDFKRIENVSVSTFNLFIKKIKLNLTYEDILLGIFFYTEYKLI